MELGMDVVIGKRYLRQIGVSMGSSEKLNTKPDIQDDEVKKA
jgi:hypothetical protein